MSKSLLSYDALCRLVEDGVIDAPVEHVGATSIDVRLGPVIEIENPGASPFTVVDPTVPGAGPRMLSVELGLGNAGHCLPSGAFCRGMTIEILSLPNDLVAKFALRSSVARDGLGHLLSVTAQPGFHGRLVLELQNTLQHHRFRLTAGMLIGQFEFYRVDPVPARHSYAHTGRYNGQSEMSSKGASA